jgi:plasmid stabilization system protein ParE
MRLEDLEDVARLTDERDANAADARRLDALADELPFDGIGGIDLHEWVFDHIKDPDDEDEVKALYRQAVRAAIDALADQQEASHD